LALAVVLVAGVAFGHVARVLRLPAVTGQILVGILIGPSVLAVLDPPTIASLEPITNFALSLVAVAVGSHLQIRRLRAARRRLLYMLIAEATITPLVVFAIVILLPSVHWAFALLLATLSISTAPATVMAIVKETRSAGVFVRTLVGSVALNNLACISLFELAHLAAAESLNPGPQHGLLSIFFAPLREIALTALLGGGVGLLLAAFTRRVVRTDLLATYSFVAILLTSGLAETLELSSLLACLFLGVVLANVVPEKEGIGHTVFDNFESAIYAAFFTIAGMELNLDYAAQAGIVALVVVLARIAGKISSSYWAMRRAHAPRQVRRFLGLALVPQAGVAVGLLLVAQEDPALSSMSELLLAVGLTVVTINEIIGPVLSRWALGRANEIGRDRRRLIDFIHEENITTNLREPTKERAIERLVDLLIQSHHLRIDRGAFLESVLAREREISTCVGAGLAIPHGNLPEGNRIVGVIGISREGLAFETPDGQPIHCMVLLATPPDLRDQHLEVLAALARSIGHDRNLQGQLFSARTPAHVCYILQAEAFEEQNYELEEARDD
jgi:mannitol/fructose-specific phosphotransferase system IIA component (Ntr-type)